MKLFGPLSFLFLRVFFGGLTTGRRPTNATAGAAESPVFVAMRSELAPLSIPQESKTPTIREYYREAIGSVPGVRHDTGTVLVTPDIGKPFRASVHVWQPADRKGETVFLVHGYLAHPLQHRDLIQELLRRRFVVVAPELPGHGLSDGERGAIADFQVYGTFFKTVLSHLNGTVPAPWHAVGHSTGATTIYEYLRGHDDPFEAVVFVAPLVRSKFYRLARFGRFLSRPFLDSVATGYHDPLGVARMPLSWFDRQVEWNRRSKNFEIVPRPVLVLQGTRDTVVAWRYNRRFLREAFTGVSYRLFDGADHVLYREAAPVGPEAVAITADYVESTD